MKSIFAVQPNRDLGPKVAVYAGGLKIIDKRYDFLSAEFVKVKDKKLPLRTGGSDNGTMYTRIRSVGLSDGDDFLLAWKDYLSGKSIFIEVR